MKKKLLSLFLALSMLLTSVLCLLPVAAEGGTEGPLDKAAREAGNVCRIGEASEGKYYNNVNTAVSEALKSNKTVTLIDNATLESSISISANTQNLVVEGNNKTLTIKGAFEATEGTLTVRNLTIRTDSSYNGQIAVLKANGTVTFESCKFVIAATGYASKDNKNQIFTLNTGSSGLLNLKSCTIAVDSASNLNAITNTAIFTIWHGSSPLITLDSTTIDLSNFNNLSLIKDGNKELKASLKIQNHSTIKTANSISTPAIRVEDSTVENTADNGNLFKGTSKN